MRKFNSSLISTLLLSLSLSACSVTSPTQLTWVSYDHVDTSSLSDIKDLHQEKLPKAEAEKEINPIRLQGLKEAALTLGAQGALSKRSAEIDAMLEKNRQNLDQIFNFQALLLADNVLPPVLIEGRGTMNLEDDNTIRIADQSYRIVQQARFATTVPNWREYLWFDYNKPDVPDPTLLPKENNSKELDAWKKYVQEGWSQGIQQSTQIFAENLARLKRDYQGMALYTKLLNEHMISAPMVAKSELGITGGGNEMTINDRFKRITAHPSLQIEGDEWRPAVAQEFTSVAEVDQGYMRQTILAPDMEYVK